MSAELFRSAPGDGRRLPMGRSDSAGLAVGSGSDTADATGAGVGSMPDGRRIASAGPGRWSAGGACSPVAERRVRLDRANPGCAAPSGTEVEHRLGRWRRLRGDRPELGGARRIPAPAEIARQAVSAEVGIGRIAPEMRPAASSTAASTALDGCDSTPIWASLPEPSPRASSPRLRLDARIGPRLAGLPPGSGSPS